MDSPMADLRIDGQPAARPEPMPTLALRDPLLPVVHDCPAELFLPAIVPLVDRRCRWCGTKLIVRAGECRPCAEQLNEDAAR